MSKRHGGCVCQFNTRRVALVFRFDAGDVFLHDGLQFRDDVGMVCGDVFGFADVIFQVC